MFARLHQVLPRPPKGGSISPTQGEFSSISVISDLLLFRWEHRWVKVNDQRMVHWGELWPDALRQAVQEFQGMNYRITDVNGRQHLGPKKGR